MVSFTNTTLYLIILFLIRGEYNFNLISIYSGIPCQYLQSKNYMKIFIFLVKNSLQHTLQQRLLLNGKLFCTAENDNAI